MANCRTQSSRSCPSIANRQENRHPAGSGNGGTRNANRASAGAPGTSPGGRCTVIRVVSRSGAGKASPSGGATRPTGGVRCGPVGRRSDPDPHRVAVLVDEGQGDLQRLVGLIPRDFELERDVGLQRPSTADRPPAAIDIELPAGDDGVVGEHHGNAHEAQPFTAYQRR